MMAGSLATSTRNVVVLAVHDLRMLLTDRAGLVWSFLMPLVFATFFGLVFSGGGAPSDAKAYLSVVDEDGGPLASRLLAALDAAHLDVVPIDVATEDPNEARVRTLVIPAGFSADVAAGTPVTLRLEKDPDSNEQAGFVAQTRITAVIVRLLADMATTAEGAAAASDDLVRLETRYAGRVERVPSGFSHSVPGNAVMFVLFIALTYGAASITAERTSGTLRRLATAPVSRGEIVAGKIAGRFLVAIVQITVFVLAGLAARTFLGLDLTGNLGLMWLVLLVYALAVAPLGVLFGAVFRDAESAANIGVLATLGMAALGGCWWPLEVVPEAMKKIALLLPTGWAMQALNRVISFGYGIEAVTLPVLVLLAFGAIFTVVAARSLKLS